MRYRATSVAKKSFTNDSCAGDQVDVGILSLQNLNQVDRFVVKMIFTNDSCVGDEVDGGKGFITCRTIKGHVSMFCKMIFTNDSRVGDQVNGG